MKQMKQRFFWGLVSALMLLVIFAFAFANVLAAWGILTNAKDAYEITKGIVNVLIGEKQTLEGKTAELHREWKKQVEYLRPEANKLASLTLEVANAERRVEDAQGVVSNCQSEIDRAKLAISYYLKQLEKTTSPSESEELRENLRYWREIKSHWASKLATAEITLKNEKYTLTMWKVDHANQWQRVYTLNFVVSNAWNLYWDAKRLLANRVTALEEKQKQLARELAAVQSAISALQSALADFSNRLDANEQLDAEQQQQIDDMREDIDRILEHLGI